MEENRLDLTNIWGDPQEYKGIKLYPIKMSQIIDLYKYVNCLLIDKNRIPDIKIIKMDYLNFIFAIRNDEIINMLTNLLTLVLKEQKFYFDIENNKIKLVIIILQNNECKNIDITGKEFEDIRKIILKQNNIKFDEELMNPDVKKALDEAQDFINRRNRNKQATLEEMIASYHASIGISYKEIKELTVYQFYFGLQRKSVEFQSQMLSTAWGMGGIKNEDLKDWLSHVEDKDRYDDVISKETPEQIKKKFE